MINAIYVVLLDASKMLESKNLFFFLCAVCHNTFDTRLGVTLILLMILPICLFSAFTVALDLDVLFSLSVSIFLLFHRISCSIVLFSYFSIFLSTCILFTNPQYCSIQHKLTQWLEFNRYTKF